MPEKRKFSLNRSYGIFFLVATILLGCLFIMQAADIYFSAMDAKAEIRATAAAEGWSDVETALAVGNIPVYSRQIVGQRLAKLLPYICIWLAILVGAIVIAIAKPNTTSQKRDPDVMLDEKLNTNRRKLPSAPKEGLEQDYQLALSQHQHIRNQSLILTAALAVIAVVCLLIPFLYFADKSHFPNENLNGEVIHALLYTLPFLLVLLAGSLVYVFLQHWLNKQAFAAVKKAIASGDRNSIPSAGEKKKFPLRCVVRLALLVVGVALFIIGTQDGSMYDVLKKATNICTECIGLG